MSSTVVIFTHWNNGKTLSRIVRNYVRNLIENEHKQVVIVGPSKRKWIENVYTHANLRYHASDEFDEETSIQMKNLEPIDQAVFQFALCAGSYENVTDTYIFGNFLETFEIAARVSLLEKENFNKPVHLRIYDHAIDMTEKFTNVLQNFQAIKFIPKLTNIETQIQFQDILTTTSSSSTSSFDIMNMNMQEYKHQNVTKARQDFSELVGYQFPENSTIILVINDDLHTCKEILHAYSLAVEENPRLTENDRTLLIFVHSDVNREFAEEITKHTNVENNVVYIHRPLPENALYTLMCVANIGCHFDRYVSREHEHFDRFIWDSQQTSYSTFQDSKLTYLVPQKNVVKNLFSQLRF